MGGSVKESEQRSSIESCRFELESFLEDVFCRSKSIFAFVGSPLRRDDRLGLVLYDEIGVSNSRLVKCEYGLENCLDEILASKPDKLVIIDAVYSDKHSAGDIVLVELTESHSMNHVLSTHTIPFTLLFNMMKNMGIEKIYVLGVVVKDINLGWEISKEVSEAIYELRNVLRNIVKKCPS